MPRFFTHFDLTALADKIAANIITTLASSQGIQLGTMNVSRAVEGGVVTSL